MLFKDLGLDNRLLKNLSHYNLTYPTIIQQQAIATAIAGRDLLASSKTGSGKTLAFVLPILHKSLKNKALGRRNPRAVILVPTRELAKQVYDDLRSMLLGLSYKAALIAGGENFNDQVKLLRRYQQFIVATPGRLADHLDHKSLFLDALETLVLDEADRMLDLGFAPELNVINKLANHRKRQTLLFSATLEHLQIENIAATMLNNPKTIAIGLSHQIPTDITQGFYLCDNLDHKQVLLNHFLVTLDYKQLIIFTATRSDTERLTDELNTNNVKAVALNGDLNQSKRNTIISQFARGVFKVLVTTDVASRGLDIANVTHVINFDMPKHTEEYVHRIGRTGRAGKKGDTISLISKKDWPNFKKVELFMQQNFNFNVIDGLEAKFKGIRSNFTKNKTIIVKNKTITDHKVMGLAKCKNKVREKSVYQTMPVGEQIFIPKKLTKE